MTRCYQPHRLILCALLIGAFPLMAMAQPSSRLQYFRSHDQSGINVFETPKEDTVAFRAINLKWGAGFTQQIQALDHENIADPVIVSEVNTNELIELGTGFNLATANLYLGAQLADGIRVNLTSYLSSRHHPEMWVKDGYLQIDKLPMFKSEALDKLMEYVTVRAGHFEINYGDVHFRRTDNGNALYNPFVGNYILDGFTTEIGAEVYVKANGLIGMVSYTGGEIRGEVTRPGDRTPSIIGKLGFDRQVNDDLRVRLTGSVYTTRESINNTLYGGDRAGSRYYLVLENTKATTSANFTSGHVNPGFRNKVTAFMVNPFIKYRGLELFGVFEQAEGRSATETENRSINQYAGEVLYRFLKNEQLFVGGRYNTVKGVLAAGAPEVTVNRIQVGGGWFITPNILLKGEYVSQQYEDFPSSDIRCQGTFNGVMFEGVVTF